jgi:hypothetical protein
MCLATACVLFLQRRPRMLARCLGEEGDGSDERLILEELRKRRASVAADRGDHEEAVQRQAEEARDVVLVPEVAVRDEELGTSSCSVLERTLSGAITSEPSELDVPQARDLEGPIHRDRLRRRRVQQANCR